MSKGMTLIQFKNRFATEEHCLEYLEQIRWPKGFICPNCGHDVGYRIAGRRLIQCAVCRHQTSVTAGTIFHKTRVSLLNWFWMIYLMAQDKGGASASRLAMQLGMYYSTVWNIMQKIRHAMGRRDEGITLGGLIELDEAIIGPHARKTGRKKLSNVDGQAPRRRRLGRRRKDGTRWKTQTAVLVMVEALAFSAGCISMNVIDAINRDTIRESVQSKVDPFSHFKADGFHSHWVLRSMGHPAKIEPMSGKVACEKLPIVHRCISLLKRSLMGTYHGVSARYLQRYLQEFCFRFNRRDKQTDICTSLLKACICANPMGYAELKL